MAEEIFGSLVGRDGAKAILRNGLRQGDVHICLVGRPASGKSVAMTCIDESLGHRARMLDASGVTPSKLRDNIAEDYDVLLLDEIDDIDREAAKVLAMPMQKGRVTKSSQRDEYDVSISTQFIAAANDRDALPDNIQSRFRYVNFPEYTDSQFLDVCSRVLVDHVGWVQSESEARDVAKRILEETDTKDCREVIDVAQLAGSAERVRDISRSMEDPEADVESDPLSVSEIRHRNMTDSDLDRIIDTMRSIERKPI